VKAGDSAAAVKTYLDAGGSPLTVMQVRRPMGELQLPLLHHMAAISAHPHTELAECLRVLVAAGADINAPFSDAGGDIHTTLIAVVRKKCCTILLHILLQAGADPCMRSSPKGITALHMAARVGSAETCELLISRADMLLEAKDAGERPALMYAAGSGRLQIVQLLLKHGADINTADTSWSTPLIVATLQQHVEVALCLLKAGADVNAVDCTGRSAWMVAVQLNSIALAESLLDHGADINTENNERDNILFKAAQLGHVSMMELLVERGLSITALNKYNHTLLMVAAWHAHTHVAEWLVQRGIPV
jgi:uncharacterized protein